MNHDEMREEKWRRKDAELRENWRKRMEKFERLSRVDRSRGHYPDIHRGDNISETRRPYHG